MGIRIDKNDEFVPGYGDSPLQGACFPVILLTNQPDSSISGRYFLHFNGSIIARAVIDDDDLQFALIVCFQERLECCVDDFAFVVGGDDYTDWFGKIHRRRTTKAIGQADDDESAHHDQRGRYNHKSPEKFLDPMEDTKSGATDVMRHGLPSRQRWH